MPRNSQQYSIAQYVDSTSFTIKGEEGVGGNIIRAALHLEARPIPLEADCMKFQPFLGWRLASTRHYNKIITRANFFHM
jgi:hypothetical protein